MNGRYSSISEDTNGFRRSLEISPPFDKRHPNPSEDYGIHGMDLRCVLIKDKRAVQFVAYLPVHLPHVAKELWSKRSSYNPFKGMGADVGYHSPVPTYDGQDSCRDDCAYTEGKCYYDGSGLRAHEWYKIFLNKGLDEIWRLLEEEWNEHFRNQLEQ